jgi:hypothetical protein
MQACRRWRQQNRDVGSHHYADAVVPFRHRRPLYQREWRFLRTLRKIRDAIAAMLLDIGQPLHRLSIRGERILAALRLEQPRVRAQLHEQQRFANAVKVTRRIASFVDDLAHLIQQLEGIDNY